MHLFEVASLNRREAWSLPVFAVSYDMAAQYFMIWWASHRSGGLPDFEVKMRNPDWPALDRELLQEALNRKTSGYARFDQQSGWEIVDLDEASLSDSQ
ncbi:hypothetical protein [Sphingomonas sp.]|jgi:hypothetical protein|uniref:hypothetical protein n=1 Tax=Sphingomonas sp. TaxID=28214 RepID=UPI002609E9E7|nr:hypothetical protein [Sphingomonas sp.]MDF2496288.1 hypothetical protein [Sphingomonas sp.]